MQPRRFKFRAGTANAPVLARSDGSVGADGVFIETHPDPDQALSDGANMLPVGQLADGLSLVGRAAPAGFEVAG